MYPYQHLIASGGVAILMYPDYGAAALLAFVGGFLIDFDHVINYIRFTGDWNLWNSYKYYFKLDREKRPEIAKLPFVFHTIEFFVLVLVLGMFFERFLPVFWGLILHLTMDITDEILHKRFPTKKFSLFFS